MKRICNLTLREGISFREARASDIALGPEDRALFERLKKNTRMATAKIGNYCVGREPGSPKALIINPSDLPVEIGRLKLPISIYEFRKRLVDVLHPQYGIFDSRIINMERVHGSFGALAQFIIMLLDTIHFDDSFMETEEGYAKIIPLDWAKIELAMGIQFDDSRRYATEVTPAHFHLMADFLRKILEDIEQHIIEKLTERFSKEARRGLVGHMILETDEQKKELRLLVGAVPPELVGL